MAAVKDMRRLEIGVFLPIAKNGFVFSSHAPACAPTYRHNLEITLLAEALGLDYVFAMAKWRGFGGKTHIWDASLESFSLMAALAPATERLALIATVNPLLYHPTTMAKMAATVDDVSAGRLGLNLITGATLGEYQQMGVVPEGYDQTRYAYAAEWVQVLKRLWSEPSVTHHGEHFHLEDCVSEPKPVQKPHPFLVCAGTSDEGLRFTAREANYAFVSGKNAEAAKQKSRRAKEIAAEEGTSIKTAVGVNLVMGATKAEAEAYSEYLIEGADIEAMNNAGIAQSSESREGARERGAARLSDMRRIYFGLPIIGGPSDLAEVLTDLALDGDIDSILLVFPDYKVGLPKFGAEIMPLLGRELDLGFGTARLPHAVEH